MSTRNQYFYFTSKEALVRGPAERDRARYAADFHRLAEAPAAVGALLALGHKYFVEEPHARHLQFITIWIESTRNPVIAAICKA